MASGMCFAAYCRVWLLSLRALSEVEAGVEIRLRTQTRGRLSLLCLGP